MDTIDIIYIAFLDFDEQHQENHRLQSCCWNVPHSSTSNLCRNRTAFAQNMSNQTVVNQTSSAMNQTSSANQTSAEPKLTTSDVQDIRKSLEEIRKDIADGKATEALQAINDMDNKLLVAMSANPPPMLEKSTGNDNKK